MSSLVISFEYTDSKCHLSNMYTVKTSFHCLKFAFCLFVDRMELLIGALPVSMCSLIRTVSVDKSSLTEIRKLISYLLTILLTTYFLKSED